MFKEHCIQKLFRRIKGEVYIAKTGWIMMPSIAAPPDSKPSVSIQQNRPTSLKKAMTQAIDTENAWIEKEGKPAHLPNKTEILKYPSKILASD